MIDLKQIKKYTPVCFSCLGRAFGRVGFGLDNRERGMEILNQIENHENSNLEDVLICESLECRVCDGLIHAYIGGWMDGWLDGWMDGNNPP